MSRGFHEWFLLLFSLWLVVSPLQEPQGWACEAKVDQETNNHANNNNKRRKGTKLTTRVRQKGAPNYHLNRSLKNGKGSRSELETLCSNDDAIHRTCVTEEMATGNGKGGKGSLSLSLTRSGDGELEGDGLLPPDNVGGGFSLSTVDLTMYAIAEIESGLANDLASCKRLLRSEAALLEYLVDGSTTDDQVFRCAALVNVETADVEDVDLVVDTTAITTTLSVEWSDEYVATLDGEDCDAATLLPCCLQNEVNEDGVRDTCADTGCDLSLCSAMTIGDNLDTNCDASDGLLSFLQCATSSFDDAESVEVILGNSTTTLVANCVSLRETIRALGDNQDNTEICEVYFSLGCRTVADLNAEDVRQLCPAPPPLTSTVLANPRTVCSNDILLQNFANFPQSGLTKWTQGRQEGGEFYYAVGQVDGGTQLYTLELTVEAQASGSALPFNCAILVVSSCELTGLFVEGIREATSIESSGGPTLYIAGVDSSQTPFVRRIDTDCNVVGSTGAYAGELTLDFDDASDNDLPFFDGLAVNIVSGDFVWTASQTSLYSPAPATTRDEQYFLTRFDAVTGQATGQFKYFAEKSNVLKDILALDDYGSFLTLEAGTLPKGVMARTDPPKTASTTAPTNPQSSTSPTIGPLTQTPASMVPAPQPFLSPSSAPVPPQLFTALPTLPSLPATTDVPTPGKKKKKGKKKKDKDKKDKDKKDKKNKGKDKKNESLGTCIYRTYVDELRLDVGVARKDLIECISGQQLIAAAHGFGTLNDVRRRRRRLQSARVCTSSAILNSCTGDDSFPVEYLGLDFDESFFAGTVDSAEYSLVEDHFGQCGLCGESLDDEVTACTKGRRKNSLVEPIFASSTSAGSLGSRIASRSNSVDTQQDVDFIRKRCLILADELRDTFNPNAQTCVDSSSCPLESGDVEFWIDRRSTYLERCCRT